MERPRGCRGRKHQGRSVGWPWRSDRPGLGQVGSGSVGRTYPVHLFAARACRSVGPAPPSLNGGSHPVGSVGRVGVVSGEGPSGTNQRFAFENAKVLDRAPSSPSQPKSHLHAGAAQPYSKSYLTPQAPPLSTASTQQTTSAPTLYYNALSSLHRPPESYPPACHLCPNSLS